MASMTITDDATEPAANPVDDADVFVRQHYHDFLNREADFFGLQFWKNQITECQQPGATCNAEVRRINVSAAFFLSIEFQETGYLVYRFYKSAYGNVPGTPVPLRLNEFLPDTQQTGRRCHWTAGSRAAVGKTTRRVCTRLCFAVEVYHGLPTTLTPAQFVDALFANGAVTPQRRIETMLSTSLGSRNTADTAARSSLAPRCGELSLEAGNKQSVCVDAMRLPPSQSNDPPEAGLNFDGQLWLGKLTQFNGSFIDAEMVKAFLVAGEYRQRFGRDSAFRKS